jgi:hypothetical protein
LSFWIQEKVINGHGGYCHHGIRQTYLNHRDGIHLNVIHLREPCAPSLAVRKEHLKALERQ